MQRILLKPGQSIRQVIQKYEAYGFESLDEREHAVIKTLTEMGFRFLFGNPINKLLNQALIAIHLKKGSEILC